MATITQHFEPTTDTFGNLTLHTTQLRNRVFAGNTAAMRAKPVNKAHMNVLIGYGFIAVIAMSAAGLFVADQAAFGHHDAPVSYYANVPLDYD